MVCINVILFCNITVTAYLTVSLNFIKMSTVRELAEQLGVSVATVSRALNDKPGVSPDTRQKVLQLAKELRYQPNVAAHTHTASNTQNIVFIIPRRKTFAAGDAFYLYILQGVEARLSSEGYGATLVTLSDEQLSAGPASVQILRERRADAVVLVGSDIPARFILATAGLGLPVLLMDNALSETAFPAILYDNRGGGRLSTAHLIDVHGHENILLLRGPKRQYNVEERVKGYLDALNTAGLQSHIVQAEEATFEAGGDAVKRALATHPDTTAVVAVSDVLAIGATHAAREVGRRVPADLAVVGFGDLSCSVFFEVPLTTVKAPIYEMGRLAARLLLEQAEGALTVAPRTTVAIQLIVRASCGCSLKQ